MLIRSAESWSPGCCRWLWGSGFPSGGSLEGHLSGWLCGHDNAARAHHTARYHTPTARIHTPRLTQPRGYSSRLRSRPPDLLAIVSYQQGDLSYCPPTVSSLAPPSPEAPSAYRRCNPEFLSSSISLIRAPWPSLAVWRCQLVGFAATKTLALRLSSPMTTKGAAQSHFSALSSNRFRPASSQLPSALSA